MEYSICKDEQPRQTVKRIKCILANLGINIKEKIIPFDYTKTNAPRSIRISIDNDKDIGTNGKGSNYINSRASGYAEFMERLQNLCLFHNVLLNRKIADASFFNENQLLNSRIKKLYNKNILKLLNSVSDKNYFSDRKIVMTPWYSKKDKEQVLLPINIIVFLQGSNGMAAGNTLEEAIVQGLSEICERYVMKQVIYNKIPMPEIPPQEYMKYNKIKEMVEYIESLGLKIKIRDASLGKKLPVVCGIMEFPNEKKINIKFGSHPSFPIAIERTITELFQGIPVKSANDIDIKNKNYIKNSRIKDKTYVFQQMFHRECYFDSKNKLADIFWNNKYDKKYTKNAFLPEDILYNNKQILKFFLENIESLTKNEIYIRDVSFLGFPSVYIYIPNMSLIMDINKNELKKYEIIELYNSINGKDNIQIDKFFKITNKYMFKYRFSKNFVNIKILLLYSILKNDKKMINFYLNFLKHSKQKFCLLINDYFKIKEKEKEKDNIKKKLLETYNEKDVNYILRILDTLSLDVLRILIYKEKVNSEQFADDEIGKILEKLFEAYKNNIPNQNNLKNVI